VAQPIAKFSPKFTSNV